MAKTKSKALVLFSGGLDSRLAVKLLQEQRIEVEAVFFLLPFGGSCCNDPFCSFKFSQVSNLKLHVIDCTKGKMLKEYLNIVKKPKYKTGAGINPCIDCRIFLLKKAKQIAKRIKADFIATGEVLGERPMSQTREALLLIEKEADLEGKILRPLSAKLLPEIEVEKKKIVDRAKLLELQGRNRKKQIALAEKYKMSYPSPGGGCLLCEKALAKRFKFLIGKNLINKKTLALVKIGRHFYIMDNSNNNVRQIQNYTDKEFYEKYDKPNRILCNSWFVVGRNEDENKIIETHKNAINSGKGKPAVYFHEKSEKNKKTALDLQKIYSSKDLKLREKFNKYKL